MTERSAKSAKRIRIMKDGPLVVSGNVPLSTEIIAVDKEHDPLTWKKGKGYPRKETYRLCRCGQSGKKPFCDETHSRTGFDGKETASREPFSRQAWKTEGPGLILMDSPGLCAGAGFCHRLGGTWKLTRDSGKPGSRKTAIQQACDCPAGRLVACEKSGKEIEPAFRPSISLVEDPDAGFSGPIWVKGRIPIESSDGKEYEPRNRVTLCRCGRSRNKPLCDGAHMK